MACNTIIGVLGEAGPSLTGEKTLKSKLKSLPREDAKGSVQPLAAVCVQFRLPTRQIGTGAKYALTETVRPSSGSGCD